MGGWRWESWEVRSGGWKWEGGLDDDKRLAVEGVAAISLVFPAGFFGHKPGVVCVLIINWIYRRVTVESLVGGDQTYWRVDFQPLGNHSHGCDSTSGCVDAGWERGGQPLLSGNSGEPEGYYNIQVHMRMAGNYNDYVYYQPVFIVVQVLDPRNSIAEVMDWWLITTVALLALFSLALLVASFAGVCLISINHGGYYGFARDVDHHIQAGI